MATRGQGGAGVAGHGRGRLTRHLQGAFRDACPAGWTGRIEEALVAPPAAARLGFDPRADVLFAPSKFCAFIPAGMPERTPAQARVVREPPGGMNAALYFSLGEKDPRFDGHVARRHLERRLRYRAVPLSAAEGPLAAAWRLWRDRCPLTLADDAVALVPPVA